MNGSPTDEELLAAHLEGDPQAFTELVKRHQQRLWSIAFRTLGNPSDAEDALQEGLIKALRSASSFRGDAAVTSWLHRIVVNAAIDRIRSQRNAVQTLSSSLSDGTEVDHLAPGNPHGNVELRLLLENALQELPADQRIAVILVDIEGYSPAEAGDILNIPPGTVKSRCARGRARLAVKLRGERENLGR